MVYLFNLINAFIFVGLTVLSCILILTLGVVFPFKGLRDNIIHFWGWSSCKFLGIQVVLKGAENIPSEGCIYLFNHTSAVDIFAMHAVLKGFRFGAKIQLFKIPIFGIAMRVSGALPIPRENKDEVIKVYEAAKKRLASGEKFALAPEGTRVEGGSIGTFKKGPFLFAISGEAPLVPVVIKGAREVLPKKNLIPNWGVYKNIVTIEVLKSVDTKGFNKENVSVLMDQVRKTFIESYSQ